MARAASELCIGGNVSAYGQNSSYYPIQLQPVLVYKGVSGGITQGIPRIAKVTRVIPRIAKVTRVIPRIAKWEGEGGFSE